MAKHGKAFGTDRRERFGAFQSLLSAGHCS
jgi:hypothetical protein